MGTSARMTETPPPAGADDAPPEDRPELYRPAEHYTRDRDESDPGVPDAPRVRGDQGTSAGEGHPGYPQEPPGGPGQ